ncbi:hypothetical protein [Geobacillus stearothermophilus]|uniref:hypothetical protein n=1 Tax=Geobacillus stearothermophilus TaxID=1422 RepID=UPI003D1B3BC5
MELLRLILKSYTRKHIVRVLDNVRIHHAKTVQTFLYVHEEQLTFIFPSALFTSFKSD